MVELYKIWKIFLSINLFESKFVTSGLIFAGSQHESVHHVSYQCMELKCFSLTQLIPVFQCMLSDYFFFLQGPKRRKIREPREMYHQELKRWTIDPKVGAENSKKTHISDATAKNDRKRQQENRTRHRKNDWLWMWGLLVQILQLLVLFFFFHQILFKQKKGKGWLKSN